MFVKSILRATWHNKSFLIRLIVIICLITVTILDSIGIITTYVYDNRLTVVRTERGNDSSAFLENITIRYMHIDSALPKSWLDELNISFLGQSEFYSSIMQEVLNGEMSFSARNKSTVEANAYAICFFGLLTVLDKGFGMSCLLKGRQACSAAKIYADQDYYGNYSRILRETNSTELEMLEKEALAYFLDTFVHYYDWDPMIDDPWRPSNYSHALTIHNLEYDETTMEIEPVDYFHKDPKRLVTTYLRMNENKTTPADLGDKATIVQLSVGPTNEAIIFQRNMQYSISIDVKNLGIYDKSQTTKCTRDPEISFGVSHPRCDDRGFLKAIVEKCGCIPFAAKKHVRKLTLDSSVTKPFCDFQHYYACSAEIGPMELDPEEDCLPSCITIRNQYTFKIDSKPCDKDECPFVYFAVTSSDHSFVIYEERYQTTFPQFVSQLGGDIGLYLGLSLLSVCQLVAFVQTQYRKYKAMKMGSNGKKGQFTRRQFLMMLFKGIKESIGSVGEDAEKPIKTGTRKEKDEEARWKEAVNAAMRNSAAIEQKLEYKMERLTKLVERVVESRSINREKSALKRLRRIEK